MIFTYGNLIIKTNMVGEVLEINILNAKNELNKTIKYYPTDVELETINQPKSSTIPEIIEEILIELVAIMYQQDYSLANLKIISSKLARSIIDDNEKALFKIITPSNVEPLLHEMYIKRIHGWNKY